MRTRNCFIHIGAHKTGTTTIQLLLSSNSSALQERGYLYPQSGRLELLPGHHNLAWEISEDACFETQYGAIDDLIREVKDRSEDVILSSEELMCSLHNSPANFSNFVALLQSNGFLVTVILYLRNQIESLARIYLMTMHSGMRLAFDVVLRPTLDKGSYDWERRVYNFDYCDVLARISQIPNVNVVVRPYEEAKAGICSDFLSIFNLTLRDLHAEEEIFENVTLPLSFYLQTFLENRLGRLLFENEIRALYCLVPPESTKVEFSPGVRSDLFERFRETNRNLFTQYGIPEPKMENAVEDDPDRLYIDKLFTEGIEARLLQTLSAQLADSAQLAEKNGVVQSLSTELGEKNGIVETVFQLAEQIRGLQSQVGLLSAQLVDTQSQLRNTEAQLKKLMETWSWRLLRQYGRIKYRFLLPLYRRFGQVSAEGTKIKHMHDNPE